LLPTAIKSALAQANEGVNYEVIVVDNNSTDRTRQVIEELMPQRQGWLRYVFEGEQGLSHARNTGIAQAKAPVIAFTDDDVTVARDWVRQIKKSLDKHSEVDYIGGKVIPQWPTTPPSWLTSDHWSPLALTDHGNKPFYINLKTPRWMVGANLAVRRIAFKQVGFFAPEVQRVKDNIGSSEDADFQVRLWKTGRQGMYVPEMTVEARVQSERLTKAYHRQWYIGNGKYSAMMGVEEMLNKDGEIVDKAPDYTTLFGTPAFLYRALLVAAKNWATVAVRGPESLSFRHEARVRYLLGYINKRFQESSDKRGTYLGELVSFTKAMLDKKLSR